MANTTRFADGAGTLKLPEFAWDFVDGLSFEVLTSVASSVIGGGNFDVVTTSALDVAGVDAWPAAGHFCINGRVYSYTSISDDTFVGCNGPYGDQAATPITEGEVGYQAVPASVVNALIQAVQNLMPYQSAAQGAGLNITIAPGVLFDGTTQYAYAGGTLALTNTATNYVHAYISGGVVTIAKNTTSWAAAKTAAGVEILPLAKITCAGGVVTAWADVRATFAAMLPGAGNLWQRVGTVLSPATAGDTANIIGTAPANSGVLVVENDSTDGNTKALVATSTAGTGATAGIAGQTQSVTDDAAGMWGRANGATGKTHGVSGESLSSDNSAYGLFAVDNSYLGNYADAAELAVPPATPDAGKWRTYFTTAGMYLISPGGVTYTPLGQATFLFGDGHDGALTKADGSTTTLTRDMYYSSITLTANSKVNANGWAIFCTGTVNIASGSQIYCMGVAGNDGGNANNATPGTPGAIPGALSNAAARFRAGVAGVAGIIGGAPGANGGAGNAGGAIASSIYASGTSAAGGVGGAGGGGGTGGAAGAAGANTECIALSGGQIRELAQLATGCFLNRTAFTMGYWNGQAGAGSGGSGAGGATGVVSGAGGGSGASGGGGGVVYIAAAIIINAATSGICADGGKGGNGGNGGNGSINGNGGGGAAGGAGGPGGEVILVYRSLTNTGTITAAGGARGTKGLKGVKGGSGADGHDGNDGAAGVAGLVLPLVI
jgi:hypothetical protein